MIPTAISSGRQREVLAVHDRDHDERDDVVDDDDREHERAQPVGEARADERQHPSANAVSVDIATPQPCVDECPALTAR